MAGADLLALYDAPSDDGALRRRHHWLHLPRAALQRALSAGARTHRVYRIATAVERGRCRERCSRARRCSRWRPSSPSRCCRRSPPSSSSQRCRRDISATTSARCLLRDLFRTSQVLSGRGLIAWRPNMELDGAPPSTLVVLNPGDEEMAADTAPPRPRRPLGSATTSSREQQVELTGVEPRAAAEWAADAASPECDA